MLTDYQATVDQEALPLQPEQKKTRDGLPFAYHLASLVASVIVSGLSVALPTFLPWANAYQSQNLYMGWALSQGQAVYSDLVSSAGFLYHSLFGLAYYFGAGVWGLVGQGFLLYLSGVYLAKLIRYLTKEGQLAMTMLVVYYLGQLALGLGGLYPIQFAQVFVLMGFWLLVKVMDGQRADEWLIALGAVTALGLLFEPATLFFWLLSLAVLGWHQIKHGLGKRGLYQYLAWLFGFLLVSYVAAYFLLNMQMLLPYWQQTVLAVVGQGGPGISPSILGLGIQGLAFLGLGFVFILIRSLRQGLASWRSWQVLALLSLLLYSVWALLSQSVHLANWLLALPFGLLLSAAQLTDTYHVGDEEHLSRRHYHQGMGFWGYLKSQAFLPLLLFLAGLAWPVYQAYQDQAVVAERQLVGTYLAKHLAELDKIYVWDQSTEVYLKAKALSSSQYPLPVLAGQKGEARELLLDELLQGTTTYLVVNQDLALPEELEKELADHYQKVSLDGLDRLAIYQLQ